MESRALLWAEQSFSLLSPSLFFLFLIEPECFRCYANPSLMCIDIRLISSAGREKIFFARHTLAGPIRLDDDGRMENKLFLFYSKKQLALSKHVPRARRHFLYLFSSIFKEEEEGIYVDPIHSRLREEEANNK